MAKRHRFVQPIPGYRIQRLLGSGATSSVYEAEQVALGRRVAIKVIRQERREKDLPVQRMKKEARVLADLEHPHVVRSIDFGRADGLLYFVMEFVDGQSAKQHLENKGPFPENEVCHIAACLASALEYTASHGITHRDVKPGNILLAKSGDVKLTDFGLARSKGDSSLTREGRTLGTPQYMSPEQVRHARRTDLRSDFYSLGATLYHLVCGRPPFIGESVAEVLHQVLYGRPEPPETWNPEVSPAMSAVIARLMARNPARRYRRAHELIQDLEAVEDGAPGHPIEVGLSWQDSARAPLFGARSPLLLGALGLLLIGVFLGGVVTWSSDDDDAPSPAIREQSILQSLNEQVAVQPPWVLSQELHRLSKEGALTDVSAGSRVALEEALRNQLQAGFAEALERAWREGRRTLENGTLTNWEPAILQGYRQGLDAQWGTPVPSSEDTMLDQKVQRGQEELLTRAGTWVHELLGQLRRDLEAIEEQLRHRVLGGPDRPGLLAEHRFHEARAAVAELPMRREAALSAAFEAKREVSQAALPSGATLWQRLPDEFVREWSGEQRSRVLLEAIDEAAEEFRGARRDLVARATKRDQARIEAGEVQRPISAWLADLERELSLAKLEIQGAHEPWEAEDLLAKYQSVLEQTQSRVGARAQQQALDRLFLGSDGEPGLEELIRQRRIPESLENLDQASELAKEAVRAFQEPLQSLHQYLEVAAQRLRSQEGSVVELRDRSGILHRGTLRFDSSRKEYRVGARSRLSLRDLSVATLQDIAGKDPSTPASQALLLFAWGGKPDLAHLDLLLDEDASTLSSYLAGWRADDEQISQTQRDQTEDEARAAWSSLEEALVQKRFEDAEAALRRVRESPRLLATDVLRPHRTKLDDYERRIRAGRENRTREVLWAGLYRNATKFSIDQEGRVQIAYDFDRSQEGADFDLGGEGVSVSNGALRFESHAMSAALKSGITGLSLPLAVDPSHPFEFKIDLYSPYEQDEPPHYVALRIGFLCVGFFRPRAPLQEAYPPQLSAWRGRLDEYRDWFFDPALGESEPRLGEVRPVGLDRARRQVLEVLYEPGSKPSVRIHLDRERVYSLTWSDRITDPVDGLELRCLSSLRVDSVRFSGRLREPGK